MKVKNGDKVKLCTGTIFSNIQRVSKSGQIWYGKLEVKGPLTGLQRDDGIVGQTYKFHSNIIKEVIN